MAKWTSDAAEYAHTRGIILEIPHGQLVSVTTDTGATHVGWVVGTSSGTDVGDNISLGRGPVVTRMYGEVKIQSQSGQVVVLDAMDIQSFQALPSEPH